MKNLVIRVFQKFHVLSCFHRLKSFTKAKQEQKEVESESKSKMILFQKRQTLSNIYWSIREKREQKQSHRLILNLSLNLNKKRKAIQALQLYSQRTSEIKETLNSYHERQRKRRQPVAMPSNPLISIGPASSSASMM